MTTTVEDYAIVGKVFCPNMHDHRLHGDIAKVYQLDRTTLLSIEDYLGRMIYKLITADYNATNPNRPFNHSGKTAYVMAVDGHDIGDETIQIIYFYDFGWYTAICRKKA